VVAGTQHMNGNQVLGYCRIRKVPTETEHDDFGRTQRQRIVLEKIFEKMKSKNIIQLGIIMNNILSNIDIKTDITKSEYNEYLQQAADLKKTKIKTLRIPQDNSYTNESYSGRYVKDVLVPKSWEDTRKQIYDFIYGGQ
jgi:anionic cell wall polymer biosynthesis LytR-Cps2A-Psr (LCP) family protein